MGGNSNNNTNKNKFFRGGRTTIDPRDAPTTVIQTRINSSKVGRDRVLVANMAATTAIEVPLTLISIP